MAAMDTARHRRTSVRNRLPARVDVGVAMRPRPGEVTSGDHAIVASVDSGVLIAVIDGLGHGEHAALASMAAAAAVREHRGDDCDSLMRSCHEGLATTRGAAISLAAISTSDAVLT